MLYAEKEMWFFNVQFSMINVQLKIKNIDWDDLKNNF
jgi:hypothetical protein